MSLHMVVNQFETAQLIEAIKSCNFISLDTEFSREKTFYPILGLMQLCIKGEIYLVDPQADIDLEAIIASLIYTDATVICHAGVEDAYICSMYAHQYGLSRYLPKKWFDTQVAANFLKIGTSIGLATLIKQFIGIELSKDQTRTDWTARPFTSEQIEYAALDVAYLENIYEIFLREFKNKDVVYKLFQAEMNEFVSIDHFENDINKVHIKLNGAGVLSDNKLRMLFAVSKLRYEICLEKNIPLPRFMKNNVLVNLIDSTIFKINTYVDKGVHYSIVREYGKLICETAKNAFNNEDIPVIKTLDSIRHIRAIKDDIKHLEKYLKHVANRLTISEDILCSKRVINDFFYHAIYDRENPSILESGWRGELLTDLMSIKDKVSQTKIAQKVEREKKAEQLEDNDEVGLVVNPNIEYY